MRTKKAGYGFMSIKINLEKAYDRLSWEFVRITLQILGLPSKWVNNIIHCVETPITTIVWHGKKLEWFNPSRGIRQGGA